MDQPPDLKAELTDHGMDGFLDLYPEVLGYFEQLTLAGKRVVIKILDDCALRGESRINQLEELLRKAVRYAAEHEARVIANHNGTYTVMDDRDNFVVDTTTPTCTCPLFRGTGLYIGLAGVCAHIMVTQIHLAEVVPTE
jgi:hypothetical protein